MTVNPQKTRKEVEALLGTSIADARLAPPSLSDRTAFDGWHLDTLCFASADDEPVPALFLHPADPAEPVSAILYCHAHGNAYGCGMDELMEGMPVLQGAYGPALKDKGFASLCIEMPAFGARQEPTEMARAKKHLWHGTTLFGQMLWELAGGINYLADHPDVDEERLGTLGFSMGSTHSYWLSALCPCIKAAVALCSFADLSDLTQTPNHDMHGIYMTVPGFLKEHSTGRLAGLTAPRRLMIGVGLNDWSTPEACFRKARTELEAAYEATPDALQFHIEPNRGHIETPTMRQAALSFLEAALG